MFVIIEETQFITIAIKISTNGKNGPFFISDKGQVSSISSPNSRKRIISRSLIFATHVQ